MFNTTVTMNSWFLIFKVSNGFEDVSPRESVIRYFELGLFRYARGGKACAATSRKERVSVFEEPGLWFSKDVEGTVMFLKRKKKVFFFFFTTGHRLIHNGLKAIFFVQRCPVVNKKYGLKPRCELSGVPL
ncbi:uncharacterized protein EV154DRAFT_478133 [Mucor mucedo]|uniref:uncharacterized protein n=1 Tax=Mucor mucedo TaxID=29922 RepID=UPI00222054BF|nr:uncharacterized protein EV154DRAFT_478133 [Mucor mucedo]KAI7894739.1 hypothetical protein EV154DRAFT_478133 [Mucor mucedo]